MGQREIGRLRQKCFTFGKTLLACGREFSFSLKVGDAFEMSLVTGDSNAIGNETHPISGGRGGVGKSFCRRET